MLRYNWTDCKFLIQLQVDLKFVYIIYDSNINIIPVYKLPKKILKYALFVFKNN